MTSEDKLRWKLGKSSLRSYSLLFMTMICDIKIKDPLSIISGKRKRYLKEYIWAFFGNILFNSGHLLLNWNRPFPSWYALAFQRANDCPHKLQSTWNFYINYIQRENFTKITFNTKLSHKLHSLWNFQISYIQSKAFT